MHVGSNQVVVVVIYLFVYLFISSFIHSFIYLLYNTSLEQSCQFYIHTSSLCVELAVENVAMPCNLVDTYKSVIGAMCCHLLSQRVSCVEKTCYKCRQGRNTTIRYQWLRKHLLLIFHLFLSFVSLFHLSS